VDIDFAFLKSAVGRLGAKTEGGGIIFDGDDALKGEKGFDEGRDGLAIDEPTLLDSDSPNSFVGSIDPEPTPGTENESVEKALMTLLPDGDTDRLSPLTTTKSESCERAGEASFRNLF
jgi:hypothetical protein